MQHMHAIYYPRRSLRKTWLPTNHSLGYRISLMPATAANAIRSRCFISQDNHINVLLLRDIVAASDVAARHVYGREKREIPTAVKGQQHTAK